MAVQQMPAPVPAGVAGRARSFLGWAFVLSFLIHAVTLPFLGTKKMEQKKDAVEVVAISKKTKVRVPTPPPPSPTPPPPPKTTPPPVKQTNPPPQPKLKVNPPKTTSKSNTSSTVQRYQAPAVGSEAGVQQGTVASAAPAPAAPAATGAPATAAPTVAPTVPPTQKPTCANPNADAVATNPVSPDYPESAKAQGVEGSTMVAVSLDANGNVIGTSINKSSGSTLLDNAAISAAKASRYQAETVNCVKTAGRYIFRADFSGQ